MPKSARAAGASTLSFPPANEVAAWNRRLLDIIRARRDFPPPAARSLAMVHLAIDDAVNSIRPTHQFYGGLVPDAPGASSTAATAAAAHSVMRTLFPSYATSLDAALTATLAGVPAADGDTTQGVLVGRQAAARILALRTGDGATSPVIYTPSTLPGYWRPTRPAFRPPLLPHYAAVRPFALHSQAQFRPPPPPDLNTPDYAEHFQEVRDLGDFFSTTRTQEQSEIALFWSGDPGSATPPGHWNVIAEILARQRGLDLPSTAWMFARLNAALADSAVAAWEAKYHYEFWRPITAIDQAHNDSNPATESDPLWTSYLITPPFPEYPSGHATFSRAAAVSLADFFGTDQVTFDAPSEGLVALFGFPSEIVRHFPSLSAAADEAARSRVYGGIHYSFADEAGQDLGAAIGRWVSQCLLLPITGASNSGFYE